MANDHLWCTLFHEVAHIVLDGKNSVSVDGKHSAAEGIEAEADSWASDMLLPRRHRARSVSSLARAMAAHPEGIAHPGQL